LVPQLTNSHNIHPTDRINPLLGVPHAVPSDAEHDDGPGTGLEQLLDVGTRPLPNQGSVRVRSQFSTGDSLFGRYRSGSEYGFFRATVHRHHGNLKVSARTSTILSRKRHFLEPHFYTEK